MHNLTTAFGLWMVLSGITGCSKGDDFPSDATMIAIGDSFLDWNRDEERSIPDVVGRELNQVMGNASISGAMVLGGGGGAIPNQYRNGPWTWVVFNGGGNDLTDECGCTDCDAVMDELLSADGSSGALYRIAERAESDGANAVVVGYMNLPREAEESPECDDELIELRTRKEAMANQMANVLFVDASDVMDGTDLRYYDSDNLHPSIRGSQAVGKLIADAITTFSNDGDDR